MQEVEGKTLLTKEQSMRFKKMVSAALFKELFEQAPDMLREQLTHQFRMHPAIMRLVNRFYDTPLICANPDKDRAHGLHLGKFLTPQTHAVWVDTGAHPAGDDENPHEASLIAKTLKAMDLQLGHRQEKIQVGVVSFYAAQVKRIKEQIREQMGGFKNFKALDVRVDTVIRFQGKEKPIILVSMVATRIKKSRHANTSRYEFVNVAFSRAQNLLMVFGSAKVFSEQRVYLPNQEGKRVYKGIIEALDRDWPQSSHCLMDEYTKALDRGLEESR
ncbi:AAA domain-containing protein [Helicobacter cynogastricus]|uniref:AAA domain-containing protein n=1 Tax=Helicobacter cynogastricus TaxID=329937 RepID=UPI002D7917D7|nr:AAA domain-containing protein [Helicobacter cynogastricus]